MQISDSQPKAVRPNFGLAGLEFWTTCVVAALFGGMPLFFLGNTWQGLNFEKQMLLSVCVVLLAAAWLIKTIITGEVRLRRTPLDIPLMVLLLAYAVSALFSRVPWRSVWGAFGDLLQGLAGMVILILAYVFILDHFRRGRFLWWLGTYTVSGLVALSGMVWAILGKATSGRWLFSSSPLGTETTSVLFVIAFFFILVSLVSAPFRWSEKKWLDTVLRSVFFVGMAESVWILFELSVFVPWALIFGGFAVFVMMALSKRWAISGRFFWLLPFLGMMFVILFVSTGGTWMGTIAANQLIPIASDAWQVAETSLKEHAFLGSGPATYAEMFSLYRPEAGALQDVSIRIRPVQAPGMFFEIISTVGIIGALAWFGLGLLFVGVGIWLLSRSGDRESDVIGCGLFVSACVLMVGSMLMPVGSVGVILSMLTGSLALGLLLDDVPRSDCLHFSLRSDPKYALPLAFLAVAVAVGLLLFATRVGSMWRADIKAAQALALPRGDNSATEFMQQALNYRKGEPRYAVALSGIYFSLAAQEMSRPAEDRKTESVQAYVESANAVLLEAQKDYPTDVVVREALARSYETASIWSGSDPLLLAQAQKEYERAAELEPSNAFFYMKIGQMKQALAAQSSSEERAALLEGARASLEVSIDKNPSLGSAYLSLGLVEEALGNNETALIHFERSVALDAERKDIDARFNLARLYLKRDVNEDARNAQDLLREVTRQNDLALNPRLYLGLAYEKSDQKDESIREYRRVLELVPEEYSFEAVRQRINTLISNVQSDQPNVGVADVFAPQPSSETVRMPEDVPSIPVSAPADVPTDRSP